MTQFITLSKYAKDITGQRYGRLVALGPVGKTARKLIIWLCRCDCGKTTRTTCGSLRFGNTTSCGCLKRELASDMLRTHGMARSHIHRIWLGIIHRCTNPNARNYGIYGGRGIVICDEWRHDFQAFYDHVSQLPNYDESGYSIDRIDNDGNYEPGNVRWASRRTQSRNTRQNVFLTHNGKTQCVADWAKELGAGLDTFHARLRAGWSAERTLTTPVRYQRKR